VRFDVITLFPQAVESPLLQSVIGRAIKAGRIELNVRDLRDWAKGAHRQADDAPFGGGDGMVMKPEPLAGAIRAARAEAPESPVVLLTPKGQTFDQERAAGFSRLPGMVLVCGHYGGVDDRVRQEFVDIELSIGDYVLTGGEAAAVVVIEAVARLVPGVLGNELSPRHDSFPQRLEAPQYTRPAEFEGMKVPDVLVSGDHQAVKRWRKKESLRRTLESRPDLFERYPPDDEERELLSEIEQELGKG